MFKNRRLQAKEEKDILEYATTIWSPFTNTLTNRMEKMQHKSCYRAVLKTIYKRVKYQYNEA